MENRKGHNRLVATTLTGLEETLAAELVALGATDVKTLHRAVEFFGDKQLLYKANLWCRTAIRILRPIKTFRAASEEELYRRFDSMSWSNYLETQNTLAIDVVLSRSQLTNSRFAALKAKDAIVDQFRKRTGVRPSVDRDNPDIRINLHIDRDLASVSLDSSGTPLSRRGYRTDSGEAPISEVLAAGIILLTGWDQQTSFVDGMCGSGTFVIEAAMLARNMAPGLARKEFGFQRWKDYAPAQFDKLRTEAAEAAKADLAVPIVGSDSSSKDMAIARANAVRAGVEADIRLEHKAFEDQTPPEGPGVLVINPPYGERLRSEDINTLYGMIGDTLKKKFEGYDAWILTGNIDAVKHVGLRASRKIMLYNGAIECRLMRYCMYRGSKKTKKKENPSEE